MLTHSAQTEHWALLPIQVFSSGSGVQNDFKKWIVGDFNSIQLNKNELGIKLYSVLRNEL